MNMVIGVAGEHHLSVKGWLIKKIDYQQGMAFVLKNYHEFEVNIRVEEVCMVIN